MAGLPLNLQPVLRLIGVPPPLPPDRPQNPRVALILDAPTVGGQNYHAFFLDRAGLYSVSRFLGPRDLVAMVTCRAMRGTWRNEIWKVRHTEEDRHLRVWLVFLQTTARIPRPPPELGREFRNDTNGWLTEARPRISRIEELTLPPNATTIHTHVIAVIAPELPRLNRLEAPGRRLPNNIDLLARRTNSSVQVTQELKELTHEQYSRIESWFHVVITHPQLKVALILFTIPICILLFIALVIIGAIADLLTFFQIGVTGHILGLSLYPLIGLAALWYVPRYLVDDQHPNPLRLSELPELTKAPHRLDFAERWTLKYSPTGFALFLTVNLGLYLKDFLGTVSAVMVASLAGIFLLPLGFLLEAIAFAANLFLLFLIEPLVAGIRHLLGQSLTVQR